jgi:RNA polymerase sigma-70 factor (ECF subfamily)
MTTLHAPNGHQNTAGGPRKADRDAELVERLRRQDPGAPEELIATAARKIDTFKGESAFGSWVYRITANAAYQKLRSRHGQRNEISWDALSPGFDELGQHAEPLRDWSGRTEEPALQTELRKLLTTAIDDLPGDYRTAFLLHDVEGLSNPEIAEALHISLPAVKSRVHRSRLFLRQRLGDYMRTA